MWKSRNRLAAVQAGILIGLSASGALAAGVVGDGTPGSCTDAALGAALVGGGLVSFDCGDFVPIPVSTHVIPSGDVTVIEGSGPALSGEGQNRHFVVQQGASLTLREAQLISGSASQGGSILNQGSLIIEDSALIDNRAVSGGDGGAIYNDVGAELTIVRTVLSFDQAEGRGGALFNRGTATLQSVDSENTNVDGEGGSLASVGGTLTVDLSRFSGTAGASGGAIHQSGGVLDVRRSLIGGSAVVDGGAFHQTGGSATFENVSLTNTQAPRGGAIFAAGGVALRNATFYLTMGDDGGSLFVGPTGAVTAVNTLFSETLLFDSSPGTHCAGAPMTSLGHNLASDASCNLVGTGDLPSTDPLIASEPGGPWGFVLAPALGSAALDAGDDTVCPATDQRNTMSRPQDGGSGTAICDIGAIEVVPEPGWSALVAGCFVLAARRGRRGRAQVNGRLADSPAASKREAAAGPTCRGGAGASS